MAHSLPIYIFGAGAHGRVVLDIFRASGRPVAGWLDDRPELAGTSPEGLPVLGTRAYLHQMQGQGSVHVAIGLSTARLAVGECVLAAGVALAPAVHPSAIVSPTAQVGEGACLCAGTVVGPGARLGRQVIVNTGATIDHDCVLEDGAWVAPGVTTAGAVHIGRLAYVSTGAVLVAGVRVGAEAVVGAGAVVVKPVPPRAIVLGVPARVVGQVDEHFDFKRLVSGFSAV
ncbi:NeuD/PglB/VioB family sugar acetyltransferase [Fontisphaera persica]|uniref:NeuD/PglB/VioB family sugar acetyltransferase n=1 Tax=Fontisphaera persica TaxID=2974023 RepID=UPI0024C07298|nr:NeuD/PglB/VioB family sugar acetyltransferase [Fontisphaera persica]WCJ59242.1 NeuD/PglB/VioB family sugar acetyltransferase [Fontisphaera persica]